jgi:flagellar hook-basal body complex protein FliE
MIPPTGASPIPLAPLAPAKPFAAAAAAPAAGGSGSAAPLTFTSLLEKSLGPVQQSGREAHEAVARLLADEEITSAEVYTTVRKHDLALRLLVQVRNKLLDAYQEIQQLRM